ncbi:hypothetical protein BU23DRAFT_473860 [Bimuria novae-zelandiae CBS 107.79]|uniref:DUF7918 domain-containing protein n=1 Tax=Bimuria novae-zelandiae CBS 107.79 TaxID=1447943 RepID=A0A6A5V1K8_9PLEO|nr:hypothetical protein BU23DRAFT_473860 [Bimuria novae-zelandiae CBS 107.79]
MPVHPNIEGVKAFVHVNGQPCEKHDDHTLVARHSVERYIIAEPGAVFEVHFRFTPPFPTELTVSVVITIDGKDLDEPLIRPAELYEEEGHVSVGPISNEGGVWKTQRYRFAQLHAGEDVPKGDIDAQKKQLAETGTISLHFCWVHCTRLNKTFEAFEKEVHDPGQVHEKALKGRALSHAVSLKEAVPTDEIEYFDAEYANNDEPFAVFHFYYRSLHALKDLHILRQTPSSIPLITSTNF